MTPTPMKTPAMVPHGMQRGPRSGSRSLASTKKDDACGEELYRAAHGREQCANKAQARAQ